MDKKGLSLKINIYPSDDTTKSVPNSFYGGVLKTLTYTNANLFVLDRAHLPVPWALCATGNDL